MAVTITGSGGLCTRLGHLAGALNDLLSLQGGTATTPVTSSAQLPTRYGQFQTDFAAGTSVVQLLDGYYANYVTAGQQGVTGPQNQLSNLANALTIFQVNADTALAAKTIQNALYVLQTQFSGNFNFATSSFAAGSQTSVGSPVGTPTIVMSVKRGDGLSLEYGNPETLTFTCTADANGSAVQNNELFSVAGQVAVSALNLSWPAGSGVSTTINNTNPAANNSQNNLLVNSNFATFTNSNVADNWTIQTGSAGTQVLKDSSNTYAGQTNSLEFAGDGSTLTAVTQQFNTASSTSVGAGGTPAKLTERTPYAVSVYYKLSAASPAAGVLEVALVNGSGTVINDDQGTANSTTVALTGVADTNYHQLTAVFRIPTNMPSTVQLRIRLSTALSSGKNVFISWVAFAKMTQLYAPLGPFVAIFASNTPPLVGDSWTVAMTTSMAGTTWQGVFQRFFGIGSLLAPNGMPLRIPTTGGSTVSTTLIA